MAENKYKEALEKIKALASKALGGSDDADEGEESATPEVNFPETLQEVNDLSKEEAAELAGKLGLEIDGMKSGAVKELLRSVHAILSDETDDLDEDAINALAEAADVKQAKKSSATLQALKEYFAEEEGDEKDKDEEEGEDEKDEKDADESEEEEEKPKKKVGKKASKDEEEEEAEDGDGDEKEEKEEEAEEEAEPTESDVDPEAIAKKAKLPAKESIMKARLEKYNTAAEENDGETVNVKKLGTEKAYRQLLTKLVTIEGEVAEWGKPYINPDQEACCCGLGLEEIPVKGKKESNRGKCLVTEKIFEFDEGEQEWTEVEDD